MDGIESSAQCDFSLGYFTFTVQGWDAAGNPVYLTIHESGIETLVQHLNSARVALLDLCVGKEGHSAFRQELDA
jgi:hypothetical protein